MAKYYKLTDSQVNKHGLSSYTGEVILIDIDAEHDQERYYYNAQEFFTQEELDSMVYLAD